MPHSMHRKTIQKKRGHLHHHIQLQFHQNYYLGTYIYMAFHLIIFLNIHVVFLIYQLSLPLYTLYFIKLYISLLNKLIYTSYFILNSLIISLINILLTHIYFLINSPFFKIIQHYLFFHTFLYTIFNTQIYISFLFPYRIQSHQKESITMYHHISIPKQLNLHQIIVIINRLIAISCKDLQHSNKYPLGLVINFNLFRICLNLKYRLKLILKCFFNDFNIDFFPAYKIYLQFRTFSVCIIHNYFIYYIFQKYTFILIHSSIFMTIHFIISTYCILDDEYSFYNLIIVQTIKLTPQ